MIPGNKAIELIGPDDIEGQTGTLRAVLALLQEKFCVALDVFAGIAPQHPRFVYDRQILNEARAYDSGSAGP